MNFRRFSGLEYLIIGFGALCLFGIVLSFYTGDAKKLHLIWNLPLWFGMFCMIHALGGLIATVGLKVVITPLNLFFDHFYDNRPIILLKVNRWLDIDIQNGWITILLGILFWGWMWWWIDRVDMGLDYWFGWIPNHFN